MLAPLLDKLSYIPIAEPFQNHSQTSAGRGEWSLGQGPWASVALGWFWDGSAVKVMQCPGRSGLRTSEKDQSETAANKTPHFPLKKRKLPRSLFRKQNDWNEKNLCIDRLPLAFLRFTEHCLGGAAGGLEYVLDASAETNSSSPSAETASKVKLLTCPQGGPAWWPRPQELGY